LKRKFAEVIYQENAQDGFVPGDEAAHRAAAALADRADAPTIGALTDMLAFLERVGGQFHVTALRLEANPDEWETHGFGLMVETRDARLKVAEAPEDVRGVSITDMQGPPAKIEAEPVEEQTATDPDPDTPEAVEPAQSD
jgi:hypothetical protein